MGVVIRMNMAAGLGRAELSWAQAAARNRCQLTHICRACWDVGVSGHGSDHLRDTVHLGPERSLAFSLGSQCPQKAVFLLLCLSTCLSVIPPPTHTHKHTCTLSANTNISGKKSKFQTLMSRSKGFDQPSWIVTQTLECKLSLVQHCSWMEIGCSPNIAHYISNCTHFIIMQICIQYVHFTADVKTA